MRLPDTSLIICSRNRAVHLRETLISILCGEDVPSEILIIDQSDVPHPQLTHLACRQCDIQYVHVQSRGSSAACNEGIVRASYTVLVFTHDDVLATPSWFGTLVRKLIASGHRSVVTGQVLPGTPQCEGGFAPSTKDEPTPATYQGRIWSDVLYPMNMAMYSAALEEIGQFDERLGSGTPYPSEDNDLGFRLLESGYRIHYTPEAVLYHRAWRTARDYIPIHWSYGCGQGGYYAKHLNCRDYYMLYRLLYSVSTNFQRSLHLSRSERREAVASAVYAAGVLYGAAKWLLTQRKTV